MFLFLMQRNAGLEGWKNQLDQLPGKFDKDPEKQHKKPFVEYYLSFVDNSLLFL
jgi:hypothetical protein